MALVSFGPPIRADIPHEPGEWMEFRKLASVVAAKARKVADKEGRQGVADFGPDIVKAFTAPGDDERAARRTALLAKAQEYDLSQFDRETLLVGTITAWSYVEKVTAETIGQLDEATARWAHQYVVDLMRPPTQEESKSTQATASPGA